MALATTERPVGCQSFQQLGETLSELSSGCDYYNGDRKSRTRVRLICGGGGEKELLFYFFMELQLTTKDTYNMCKRPFRWQRAGVKRAGGEMYGCCSLSRRPDRWKVKGYVYSFTKVLCQCEQHD